MTRIFRTHRTMKIGLIGTPPFSVTNVTLDKAGFCWPKVGSLIRRSTREPRQISIQERPIHSLQALFSATRNSIMAAPTYGFVSYGVTTVFLDRKSTRLNSSHIPLSRM